MSFVGKNSAPLALYIKISVMLVMADNKVLFQIINRKPSTKVRCNRSFRSELFTSFENGILRKLWYYLYTKENNIFLAG